MSNNKQTSVEFLQWALEHTILNPKQIMQTIGLFEQAKAMHKEEVHESYSDGFEFALINECAKESTSNASSYFDGYKEGYNRALELSKWAILNLIPPPNKV